MKIERQPIETVLWESMDGYEDRVFSQRRAWLQFIAETQGGEIVITHIQDEGKTVGYFTGILFKKFGFKIMGSPFPGWTTPYLGFNLLPNVSRKKAVAALIPFIFKELGCIHLELANPYLCLEDVQEFEFKSHIKYTYVSDLSLTEDALFAQMQSACRRCIRKAEKNGIHIEEASPIGFAEEYFRHLTDVFAKQNLKPTYGQERIEQLVKHLHPTGDLLLLRAWDAEGRSIATGIYPGFNKLSYFFGNASLRQFQQARPNEIMHWYAMRYWKNRGVENHYWGGGGTYKEKYGGSQIPTTSFSLSKYKTILAARLVAEKLYRYPRTIKRMVYLRKISKNSIDN